MAHQKISELDAKLRLLTATKARPYLLTCLSTCLPICLSTCLSVCLTACMSSYLSAYFLSSLNYSVFYLLLLNNKYLKIVLKKNKKLFCINKSIRVILFTPLRNLKNNKRLFLFLSIYLTGRIELSSRTFKTNYCDHKNKYAWKTRSRRKSFFGRSEFSTVLKNISLFFFVLFSSYVLDVIIYLQGIFCAVTIIAVFRIALSSFDVFFDILLPLPSPHIRICSYVSIDTHVQAPYSIPCDGFFLLFFLILWLAGWITEWLTHPLSPSIHSLTHTRSLTHFHPPSLLPSLPSSLPLTLPPSHPPSLPLTLPPCNTTRRLRGFSAIMSISKRL